MSQKLLSQLALLVLVLLCSLQPGMLQVISQSSTMLENIAANLSRLNDQIQEIHDDLKNIHAQYTCGGTGGWRRVAYLDMTDNCTTCPSGWNMTELPIRTCGRATDGVNTCDSVIFPVRGDYCRICGRIRAYQYASPDAFYRLPPTTLVGTIDNAYVDGVSVTHGTPRNHIWTFAAGLSESNPTFREVCPCDASINISVPLFVGKDYFCESGLHEPWNGRQHFKFYPNDTLWDGKDCLPSSKCCLSHKTQCCSQRNLPYFIKQLPTSTTDDIEARICLDQVLYDENIAVEVVELYVQ